MGDEKSTSQSQETPKEPTEAAVKLAEEEGIDLEALKGSGSGGAVTKEDVETAVRERDEAKAAEEAAKTEETRYSREELLAGGHALTGYSRTVLAGALHGDDRKSFTLGQAKEAARKFLRREVEA
jgi:pyruvate/2-oxoglutarate dehydrogenase complex dihydrolipoamide acyltransferase (E2) component